MASPKLLIVEPEPHVLSVLQTTSHRDRHVTMVATNAASALRIARTEKPDVIVVNMLNNKGMDGTELCRLLRAEDATSDAGIVLVTDHEDAHTVPGTGADGCLFAGFGGQELTKKIDEVVKMVAFTTVPTKPERPSFAPAWQQPVPTSAKPAKKFGFAGLFNK